MFRTCHRPVILPTSQSDLILTHRLINTSLQVVVSMVLRPHRVTKVQTTTVKVIRRLLHHQVIKVKVTMARVKGFQPVTAVIMVLLLRQVIKVIMDKVKVSTHPKFNIMDNCQLCNRLHFHQRTERHLRHHCQRLGQGQPLTVLSYRDNPHSREKMKKWLPQLCHAIK